MQKIIYFIKILFFFWIVLSPFFTGISGICKNKISYGSNQGKQFFFYNYGTYPMYEYTNYTYMYT